MKKPDVRIFERGNSGLIIEIDFPAPQIEDVFLDGKKYHKIVIEGTEENFELGRPALPYLSKLIALPPERDAAIEILEMDTQVLEGLYTPFPHQAPPSRERASSFIIDEKVYEGGSHYPQEWVKIGPPSIMRDIRLSPLYVYPVRWNPLSSKLIFLKSIKIRIEYNKAAKNPKFVSGLTRSFIPFYKKLLNFSKLYSHLKEVSGSYLIVVYDEYFNSLIPFRQWKNQRGIKTYLVKASDIADPLTYSELRGYIENAYFNWSNPPEFVLLFGDADEVPPGIGIGGAITDHLYTTLEGNDYLPDIHIGRIPVSNVSEAEYIVEKILMYERNPILSDTLWYRSGMTISGSDYVDDYNAMRCGQIMVDYGGFLHVDSLFQSNGRNTVTNVLNGLNEGRSWLAYFGHGFETGWSSINPDFTNSHVYQLQNTKKLPVIVDIACSNGAFNYSTDCFAEAWLKVGSIGDERGAIGIFASTAPCAFFYTDTLGRGTFLAYFVDSMFNYGAACDGGKFYMYQYFPEPPGGTTEETMQLFDAFGDPELMLWSGVPKTLLVETPNSVPIGYSQVFITVRNEDLTPIKGALVGITQDTVLLNSGYTDQMGQVTLDITIFLPTPLTVTVTSHNHLPQIDTIIPSSEGPYVSPTSYIIDDDTLGSSFGNNDSTINPGEIIELGLWVKNWGNSVASTVSAILSPLDTSVSMIEDSTFIGDLAPGESLSVYDAFVFEVTESLPDGYILPFELEIFSISGDTWRFNPSFMVLSPILSFNNLVIVDSSGDGVIDPGESASLLVEILNSGHSSAGQVNAILRTEDTLVTVIDSTSNYGNILPDSTQEGDEFIIRVSEETPIHYEILFTLIINAEGFQFVDSFTITVGIGGDFLVYDPDPNHSSGPVIKNILDSLGLRGDYTTNLSDYADALPFYGALFITVGIYPTNYIILANSQEASLVESYLTQYGGNVYLEGGDVWYWDPLYEGGYNFGPLFGINPVADGLGDLSTVLGINGTFTEGMSFVYSGENNFIDQLAPTTGFSIFQNQSPYYICGIAYEADYKTVGFSFELGGLSDSNPPSTKRDLVEAIANFFGIITKVEERFTLSGIPRVYELYPLSPNPANGKSLVRFALPRDSRISLRVYDVSGRSVRTLMRGELKAGIYSVSFDGRDDRGRVLSSGIYFIRLDAGDFQKTRKMVLLR